MYTTLVYRRKTFIEHLFAWFGAPFVEDPGDGGREQSFLVDCLGMTTRHSDTRAHRSGGCGAPDRPENNGRVGLTTWIEKALIKGTPFRESSSMALGKALVSPIRSESGADVYFQLREVKRGDTVLHLIENMAIVGYSTVESPYSEIAVGHETWYRVPLSGFKLLEPPLRREWFFDERYRPALLTIIEKNRRLFYTRRFTLMQGRYLSRVPRALLEILDCCYREHSDKSLFEVIASANL